MKPQFAGRQSLSTGEVASLCSVTRDSVLKWIRAGKIPARRTPGGHYRISRKAIQPIIDGALETVPRPISNAFQYCWEYNSDGGEMPEGCEKCIVFRSGSKRCYEMKDLPAQAGYVGLFCKGSCDECEYFKLVRSQEPNVLVVTDRKRLTNTLKRDPGAANFRVQVTDCEYRCSALIESFRPDFIVIDCSMGIVRSREFSRLLYEDSRIPFARIVLAGDRGKLPDECDKMVYATIPSHLTSKILAKLVANASIAGKKMRNGLNRAAKSEAGGKKQSDKKKAII
jgi:excisionase family DNA binding protein